MIKLPNPIPLTEIQSAALKIHDHILRTPIVKIESKLPFEVYLKLENIQPIGSFKLRGAGNLMESVDPTLLKGGVYTASAGNMAQGVAWYARKMGLPCRVIVPDHAPDNKLKAIEKLGASYVKVPFDQWWQVLVDRKFSEFNGYFIHPVSDPNIIAGNGTIGLEIIEDLPDTDAIIVPYGGGGLSCGIASAVKAINPEIKVYASEVETACPLSISLKSGKMEKAEYKASFVDGIGSSGLLPEMWPLAYSLLDGALVNSLSEIAISIGDIYHQTHTIAEGAGASSLAAAKQLENVSNVSKVVCVISGGNIDIEILYKILSGDLP